MNPVIDPWLRRVHASGVEVAVQLIVSGKRVSGFLTPYQRYEAWEDEVRRRAQRPITPGLAEQVVEQWPAMEAELDEGAGFLYACIRDATIHEATPMLSSRVPMLMVLVSEIAAAALGLPGDSDAQGPAGDTAQG